MARMVTCNWYNGRVEDVIAYLEANDEVFFYKTLRSAYNLNSGSRPHWYNLWQKTTFLTSKLKIIKIRVFWTILTVRSCI